MKEQDKAEASESIKVKTSGDLITEMRGELVKKAEDGTFGDGVAGAMKGAAIGAGIGTGVVVGVGAVVVASVVLGNAAIGAAIGLSFGPFAPIASTIGALIGVLVGFFSAMCASGGKVSPEEAKAAFLAHLTAVHNARKLVKAWEAPNQSPQWKKTLEALKKIGYYQEVYRLSKEEDDINPMSLMKNPTIRIALRAQLAVRGIQLTDAQLVKEIKARFEVKPGQSVRLNARFFEKPRNLKALYVTMVKRKPLRVGPMIRRADADVWSIDKKKKMLGIAAAGAVIAAIGIAKAAGQK